MIAVHSSLPDRHHVGSLALAGASVMVLVFLSHHPVSGGAHDARTMLEALTHLGERAALVHALLIGLVGMLLFGVIDLADALAATQARQRTGVAFGLALYGGGCAAVTAAMLGDGFVTPQLAARLLERSGTGGEAAALLDSAPALFVLLGSLIQVSTKAGLLGMGLGMVCLSWAGRRRGSWFAALGPLAGLLPVAVAVWLGTRLQPHSLIVLAACQALWYFGAARVLWTLRMAPAGTAP